ncbi:hypothetical protein C8F04DRAFT_1100442 [Mycena alexandri]|uniref:Uncharacterized protein n=1 Tax=Mycena alexandri TaxID=1745969 RepID=A0AAD6X7D7_9AGAR|nr:hypothetical protein C8F04DRAFT_1100442 [Mycena alexandri]
MVRLLSFSSLSLPVHPLLWGALGLVTPSPPTSRACLRGVGRARRGDGWGAGVLDSRSSGPWIRWMRGVLECAVCSCAREGYISPRTPEPCKGPTFITGSCHRTSFARFPSFSMSPSPTSPDNSPYGPMRLPSFSPHSIEGPGAKTVIPAKVRKFSIISWACVSVSFLLPAEHRWAWHQDDHLRQDSSAHKRLGADTVELLGQSVLREY